MAAIRKRGESRLFMTRFPVAAMGRSYLSRQGIRYFWPMPP